MKRMLINASHDGELRVALVDGQTVFDLDIESSAHQQTKSNIYKGKITRVEPSLEAAFVDFGGSRHGFLPLKEVAPTYYPKHLDHGKYHSIKDVLKEGQEIIVQVEKEERGNKGAALTTSITIPGCYLVLMPNNSKAGGVSRRLEGDDREDLKEILNNLNYPKHMGLIIRTAGAGKSLEELQWDLDILLKHWEAIQSVEKNRAAPFLIYQEGNGVIRAIRDYLRKDIDEVVIDNKEVYEEAKRHIAVSRSDFVDRVKFYEGDAPLFSRFQIESQIESAFAREVRLPSGGSIVIDHTEALVSIDINSAKSTKGSDIEGTALHTNTEAAREIARQLRLRDLGGLVVIDFIDMVNPNNQRAVEEALQEALSIDRARMQVGRITRFGLLEMSRQRLRPSLSESLHTVCPRCEGRGTVRGIESISLTVIRIIEEHSLKENTAIIRAQVPVEMATYILNEKRSVIVEMEKRQGVLIQIIGNPHFHSPQYDIERVRTHEAKFDTSYKLMTKPEKTDDSTSQRDSLAKKSAEPAIKSMPIPDRAPPKSNKPGLISRLLNRLFGKKKPKKQTHEPRGHHLASQRRHHSQGDNRRPQHPAKSRQHKKAQGDPKPRQQQKDPQKEGSADVKPGETSSQKPRRQHNRRRNNNPNRGGNQGQGRGGNLDSAANTPRNDSPQPQNTTRNNEQSKPEPQQTENRNPQVDGNVARKEDSTS